MKKAILILSLYCFLAGCQYDPYANDYTTTQPDKQSLVGTYHFEQQTVNYDLNDTCFSKSTIILYGDMSYKAMDISYFEKDTNYHYKYHSPILKQGK